jgi:hypothetical protein
MVPIHGQKDDKGSIGKIGLDGKIINIEWVRGLNAPKGMGIFKNNLYVADITDVVVIDIDKGEIKKRIPVPNAEGLNDNTVESERSGVCIRFKGQASIYGEG